MNDYAIRDLLFAKHQGKENAIKSSKIVELLTGQPSTESLRVGLRQSVVRLRKQGYPIASRITGYYWATSPEEMILFQKWLRRKALHSLALNSKIDKRTIPDLVGQLAFPLKTQAQSVTVVSALIDMPEDLHSQVQAFLDSRPEWDLDRLAVAAIQLFLINQAGVRDANL